MFQIKRLYSFILQSFIPVFMMTFGICLFIVLMQFLWKYIENLVGKGLDNLVLIELFFYAALNLIPLALPLSILLASLMTFGNLGERLELLAIKASGVSLLKAMRPLIILIVSVSIGAFFFQNEAMPRIGVKFRTLFISVKQKSPEMEIPEGSFYNGIDDYSIYVKKKNPETGMLYNIMIYDTSKGFNDMTVFVSDSARMQISEAKDFLLLSQYSGQCFSSFRDADLSNNPNPRNNKNVPYSREDFKQKNIIINSDANFNRLDESSMEGSQISMNLKQLNYTIDSLRTDIDSLNREDRATMARLYSSTKTIVTDTLDLNKTISENVRPIDFDSLTGSYPRSEMINILDRAKSRGENSSSTFQIQSWSKTGLQTKIRQYEVEQHRKFTLSFACLIFFFIGAPLGAIIRKGGLGMPVIISVIFFIIYYIFDNVGVKMARDGVWHVWQGMWLSSFILFPLGIFLTYKAMNDSELFNTEAYGKFFRKILKLKSPETSAKSGKVEEIEIPNVSEISDDVNLIEDLRKLDIAKLQDIVLNYQTYGYKEDMRTLVLSILKEKGFDVNEFIQKNNTTYREDALDLFSDSSIYTILGYILSVIFIIGHVFAVSNIVEISYLFLYIRSLFYYFAFYKGIINKRNIIYHILVCLLFFIAYPILYYFIRQKMYGIVNSKK